MQQIELPLSLANITFSQWEDFKALEEKYLAETSNEDPTIGIEYLTKAVGCIIDVEGLPYYISENDMSEPYQLGQSLSVFRAYKWILTLATRYSPLMLDLNYTTTYKGEKFQISNWQAVKLVKNSGKHYLDETMAGITALEMIELLEFESAKQAVKHKDPEHVYQFSFSLKQVAILLRKPGEDLPLDKGERTTFINKRMKFFEDLTVQTVFDVRFFLISRFQAHLEGVYKKACSIRSHHAREVRISEVRNLAVLLLRLGKSWDNMDTSQIYKLLTVIDGKKYQQQKPSLRLR